MESHQSVKLHNTHILNESLKPKPDSSARISSKFSEDLGVQKEETGAISLAQSIGILEVYIHQAREIQNICIYHKQDVYAKLSLTSDPEATIFSKIVPAGGNNPVFNEKLHLDVRTINCSLKCEIWMLSRIRNYLEDQYLGFALVPLSDVLIGKVRPAQEFSLSSTDLTHSPAGFVQLSIAYNGRSPDVLEISAPNSSTDVKAVPKDVYDKIEFPDPKIINEARMLVSQYFGVSSTAEVGGENSVSMGTASKENQLLDDDDDDDDDDDGVGEVNSVEVSKTEINPSPEVSIPPSSQSMRDGSKGLRSPNKDNVTPEKEKSEKTKDEENGSPKIPVSTKAQPAVDVEAEQEVMQKNIVDMYMKSMQEFTESLANMKLPMGSENRATKVSSSGESQASEGNGNRVFYGSRAFF